MLIRPRKLTAQPQTPAAVDPKYRPIGGLQPGGFGFYDSTGAALTVGTGITRTVQPEGVSISTSASNTGLFRACAPTSFPATFVFAGRVGNGSGPQCMGSLATTADKLFRVYANPSTGTVSAQGIGATTNAAATTGAVWQYGTYFTVVAVFASATDIRVYASGSTGISSAASTTNIGAVTGLNRLSFGCYNGSVTSYSMLGSTALAQWLGVGLTDAEATALLPNVWSLFSSPRRSYMPALAAVSGVTPTTGHGTATGYAATVSQPHAVTGVTGHGAATGYAPTISQPHAESPTTGHIPLTGYAPTVARSAAQTTSPLTGHVSLTGYTPSIRQPNSVAPTVGHVALTGYAATISQPHGITGVTGHGTATGYSAAVGGTANQSTTGVTGHGLATGYAPTDVRGTSGAVTPGVGHGLATGYAATISQPHGITGVTGHSAATGYAPTTGQPHAVTGVTGHGIAAGYAAAAARTANQAATPSTGHTLFTGRVASVTQGVASPNLSPSTGHSTATGYLATLLQGYPLSGGGGPDNDDDTHDHEEHLALAAKAGKKMYGKALPAAVANTPLPAAGETATAEPSTPRAPSVDASLASVLRPNPAVAAQLAGEHRAEPAISAASAPSDESEEECLLLLLLDALIT